MSAVAERQPFTGKVSREWFDRGIWLSQAWKTIPTVYLAAAREAATKYATLQGCESMHFEYAEAQTGDGFGEYREHKSQLTGEDRLAWTKYANRRAMAEMAVLNSLVGYYHGGMYPLVAFGSPDRAGAEFEWISPLAWKHMKPIAGKKDIVSGGGNIYYDVHVVDFGRWPREVALEDTDSGQKIDVTAAQSTTPEGHLKPWSRKAALHLVTAAKMSGFFEKKPSRPEMKTFLKRNLTPVSDRKADDMIWSTWERTQNNSRKAAKTAKIIRKD